MSERIRNALERFVYRSDAWNYHRGIPYLSFLQRVHEAVQPTSYLEIGVDHGDTLELARCPAVAIDPDMHPRTAVLANRPATHLFRMTSDEFFATFDLLSLFPRGVDLAFLDGMHQFEFLLRDFFNTEKYCRADSMIVLHDCLPANVEMTEREHRPDERPDAATRHWWTGDVWKLLPILSEYRPDIRMVLVDAPPTGLVILTGLDPASRRLRDAYEAIVARYSPMTIADYGFNRLASEFPTSESAALTGTVLADLVRPAAPSAA